MLNCWQPYPEPISRKAGQKLNYKFKQGHRSIKWLHSNYANSEELPRHGPHIISEIYWLSLLEEKEDMTMVSCSSGRKWWEVMANLLAWLYFVAWNVCPGKGTIQFKNNTVNERQYRKSLWHNKAYMYAYTDTQNHNFGEIGGGGQSTQEAAG